MHTLVHAAIGQTDPGAGGEAAPAPSSTPAPSPLVKQAGPPAGSPAEGGPLPLTRQASGQQQGPVAEQQTQQVQQDQPDVSAPQGQDFLPTFGLIAVIFVVFYFLLIRPQQKEAKRHQKLLTELQKGDEVVTGGGLVGRIYSVDERTVTLDVGTGDRTRVRVLKSSVQRRWQEAGEGGFEKKS